MNMDTISGSCPQHTFVEEASHLYSCSGLPKIGNSECKDHWQKILAKVEVAWVTMRSTNYVMKNALEKNYKVNEILKKSMRFAAI